MQYLNAGLVLLVVLLLAAIVVILYDPSIISYNSSKEGYSYLQYLEPEDEHRTTRDLQISKFDGTARGCSACSALSPFEIPYYLQDSMCNTYTMRTLDDDPGYFLGTSVI